MSRESFEYRRYLGLRVQSLLLAMAAGFASVSPGSAIAQSWQRTSAVSNFWSSIASSADGLNLVAAAFVGEGIYLSADSGLTWTKSTAPSFWWTSVASSADGSNLVAVAGQGGGATDPIYVSTDVGASWKPTTAPLTNWNFVTCSGDGT